VVARLHDIEPVAPDSGGVLIANRNGASMTGNSRDDGKRPRPVVRPDIGPAATDHEQVSDSILIERISRGSVPAFAALFDRTSDAARAELTADLPGAGRAGEILAASYVEVWWLAGCRRTSRSDATTWITGIVRRRVAEAGRAIPRQIRDAAMEDLRPSHAELEVASLLQRPVDRLLEP
jgi:hypothetical protein